MASLNYNEMTVKELKETDVYKSIPSGYNKSKLNRKNLIELLVLYESEQQVVIDTDQYNRIDELEQEIDQLNLKVERQEGIIRQLLIGEGIAFENLTASLDQIYNRDGFSSW